MYVVTLDDKTRTLGLVNLDGFQIRPSANDLRRVVGFLRRERHHPKVLDGNDFHRVQVNNRDDVLNRSGITIVVRARPNPGQCA